MSASSLPADSAGEQNLQKRNTRMSTAAPDETGGGAGASPPPRYSTRMSSVGGGGLQRGGAPLESSPSVEGPLPGIMGAGGEIAESTLLQSPPQPSPLSMGVREYLEQEIVPALVPALAALCEERPPAPVEYLAHYLLEKSYQKAV